MSFIHYSPLYLKASAVHMWPLLSFWRACCF